MSIFFNRGISLPPYPHNDDYHLTTAKRNYESGVAATREDTLLSANIPPGTKTVDLHAGMLDISNDTDRWAGAYSNGSISYSSGVLTFTGSTGNTTFTRALLPFGIPLTSKMIEFTVEFSASVDGEGGYQFTYIGFTGNPSNQPEDPNRYLFTQYHTTYPGSRIISTGSTHPYLNTLPIGRNLTSGDIVCIRLDRASEEDSSINIARYYVNGQKQYEYEISPTLPLWAHIMVYNTSYSTTPSSFSTRYVGLKVVP